MNPDTIWREEHINEFEILQKTYFDKNLIPILLVNKNKSFDKSFIGDFNLNQKGLVTRDRSNQMIYTGAQIINRKIFKSFNVKHFSINRIWDQLISKKLLSGIESQQKFFHINTKKTYEKLILEKIIH